MRSPWGFPFLSTGEGVVLHVRPLFGYCSGRYSTPMTVQFTHRLSSKTARFPNRIRYFRVQAGLSQRQLGTRIRKGREVISAWERGLYLPSMRNVFRLARTFSVTVEQLYSSLYLKREAEEEQSEAKP